MRIGLAHPLAEAEKYPKVRVQLSSEPLIQRRNAVRFCEVRRAIDHDEELYDSSNLIKIAHGGFEHTLQFNGHPSCGDLALFQADLIVHLPAEELAALFAKAAGEMNLVT